MRNLLVDRLKAGLLALSVAGCTHMSSVTSPADFLAAKKPARVWVTGPDNSELVVSHPAVRGDTLSGFANDKYFEIPMSDVKLMRASVPSAERTLLFAGAGAVALGVVLMQTGNSNSCKASATGTNTSDGEGDTVTPSC